ncbi:hypothetical protein RB597_008750 [Gaeumannomyces tritici]
MVAALSHCRWFTRGWTLQELLAPLQVHFFGKTWQYLGSKVSGIGSSIGLTRELESITDIPFAVLDSSRPVIDFCIAQRMSWAAGRVTTRKEDKAYCLMGLFDINMPLLYGEGAKAFQRLQERPQSASQTTPSYRCLSLGKITFKPS